LPSFLPACLPSFIFLQLLSACFLPSFIKGGGVAISMGSADISMDNEEER
jgi:hypothetical protein